MTTDSTIYIVRDSVAVVRRRRPGDRRDSLAWLPVFLRESDLEPFVRIDDEWLSVNGLVGFERYEKCSLENKNSTTLHGTEWWKCDNNARFVTEGFLLPTPHRAYAAGLHHVRRLSPTIVPFPQNKCKSHAVYRCRSVSHRKRSQSLPATEKQRGG